jgi:hypothetical protein
LKQILRGKPGQAIAELDTLVYEVFGLVETQMPQVDIAPLRMDYQTRRQPFEEPPNDLINQVFRA